MLPYKKKARETRLKSLQNTLKYVVVANNMWKIIYTGKKLASKFNIKDEIGKPSVLIFTVIQHIWESLKGDFRNTLS